MSRECDDYLSALLTEGPPAARCELVRHLPSDDFGPRVLGRLRHDAQPITVRGIAIADAAWVKASSRLQALAGIRSDHAAPLVAYGRHEGLAYLIHEHKGGPRLTTLLRECEGRLELDELLPIFGQLVLAVSEAHRRGVVLGGVRPQDIRVLPQDDQGFRVYIRNLGLAAVLGVPAGRAGSTDHASLYRAPELDIAKHPASDVFSLGVLFVRLLTGPLARTTSNAERSEMLRTRLEQAQRENRSLTNDLIALMLRVVDCEVARRPRSATRVLEGLVEMMPLKRLGLDSMPQLDPDPRTVATQPDVPQRWPAREWTQEQRWDRPPPEAAPRHVEVSSSERVTLHVTPPIAIPEPPPPKWPTQAQKRSVTRSSGTIRRIAMGVGLLSTLTAVALTLGVGEPGATTEDAAASLATADATADIVGATATATAEAPSASSGTVFIQTEPPGVLTIDGRRFGSTPTQVTIPPGRHVVRVEAAGHQTWRSRIELVAGQEHRAVVSLEPEADRDHGSEPVRIGLLSPM